MEVKKAIERYGYNEVSKTGIFGTKHISDSKFTQDLELRRKDDSPIFTAMYVYEVFYFFEEIVCLPMDHRGEEFTIHENDIRDGGKFEKFAGYSIKKLGQEFGVSIYLG